MSGSGTPQQRTKAEMLFREIFRYTNILPSWVRDGEGDVRIAFNDGIPSQSRLGTQCQQSFQRQNRPSDWHTQTSWGGHSDSTPVGEDSASEWKVFDYEQAQMLE